MGFRKSLCRVTYVVVQVRGKDMAPDSALDMAMLVMIETVALLTLVVPWLSKTLDVTLPRFR